ncbi:hypothetical protein GCM10009798_25800 [Nocardioides panacihumi]|uniref:TetR/AcrR family transcriptional regulator n=1 Tax=Nocardioides panacihumi TaxID=400774 RepID=A0ABP5CIN7_9ACTN
MARLAGVSTGSIYGRVAGKDDLIRVAHAREMRRIDLETTAAFARVPQGVAGFEDAVRLAVQALAELLQRNAQVLAPFMLLGRDDPVISERGGTAHLRMQEAFIGSLQGRTDAHGRAQSEGALRWACTVVWSVLARQLGLGNDREAAADYELDEVVTRLTAMLAAYLVQGSEPT